MRNLFYFGICIIWILLLFVPVIIIPESWGGSLHVDEPLFMAAGSGLLLACEVLVCLLACAALFFYTNLRMQRMLSIVGLAFALFYAVGLTLKVVNGVEIAGSTAEVMAAPGLGLAYLNILFFALPLVMRPKDLKGL